MSDVFVVTEHLLGELTPATFELLTLARGLSDDSGGKVIAGLVGSDVEAMTSELGAADRIVVVDDPALAGFNPAGHSAVFESLIAASGAGIVLVPYTSAGMDVAPAVAAHTGIPLVSFCTAVSAADGLSATCRLYAGKVEADVKVSGERAIFAMLAGSASADSGRSGGEGKVELVTTPVALGGLGVELLGINQPEAGDVDITAEDLLVVVGRGIESQDNIEEASQLADSLGGALAASRPIIDQGWLPKSRQVGKSGLTVKPKVYLTLGVSGAPEHVEGMKDSGTIISVNTDPQAPIFSVAHYGWVGDLFDLLPELIDQAEGG